MEEITTVEGNNQEILEALNNLNSNMVATNDSIKEMQEFLIIQDRRQQQKEATIEEQEAQDAETQALLNEQSEQEEASKNAEASAKADAQNETYQEILTDLRTQVELSNELQAVNTIWFGVICGLLFVKILIDRIIRI